MRESAFSFVLLVALVFAVSFPIPAEDDPETPYDESELLPYEVAAPLLGSATRQNATSRPISRTDLVVRLRFLAASGETRVKQSEPTRQHPSKSITILNCLRRC